MSFDDCAAAYFASHKTSWASAKHRQQFTSSIAAYVSPVYRPEGVNPASWRKLSMLLPSHRKLKPIKHFAALPHEELPAFMATLKGIEAMSARALEFTILTAARAGEACGARWNEIDFDSKLWTVPAGRMKMRRTHRVPLSEPPCRLLERLQAASVNHFVFPGHAGSLSPDALFMLLRRMGRGDITTHGFRSSFRDWAGDTTNFPREIAEAALAHASGDATERSYRRGDALDKRRALGRSVRPTEPHPALERRNFAWCLE
jgi:integrase